jgi:hypothetical protein
MTVYTFAQFLVDRGDLSPNEKESLSSEELNKLRQSNNETVSCYYARCWLNGLAYEYSDGTVRIAEDLWRKNNSRKTAKTA